MKEFIYGLHAVTSAIDQVNVSKIYLEKNRQDQKFKTLIGTCQKKEIDVIFTDQAKLGELVGEVRHQGVVAELSNQITKTEDDLYNLIDHLEQNNKLPFLLFLDSVTDPHNVGACLRSAEAFGIDAVITPMNGSCGLTPAARKVASGAAERVPFFQVVNLSRCIDKLKKYGFWVIGLAGEAQQTIYQTDFKGRCCIVMGAEGKGIRRLVRESCDFLVKIPMQGDIESLNISVATGVVLSEAARTRQ